MHFLKNTKAQWLWRRNTGHGYSMGNMTLPLLSLGTAFYIQY
jgi:hypothetical protein